jgi:NADH-quinone oxidoreductase subunit F
VMDEDTCMVDVARYFTRFLSHESCGKCVPCREGLRQMTRILDSIANGTADDDAIETLEDLASVMSDASLCALGQTAANPILSTLRYFRQEYEIHIREHRCPAKVCKALVQYAIDPGKCKSCGACLKACPTHAIRGQRGVPHVIDQTMCTRCGACIEACPKKFGAIVKLSGEPLPLTGRTEAAGHAAASAKAGDREAKASKVMRR